MDATSDNVPRFISKNEGDRTSVSKYYTPSIEIKDFDVSVNGNIFLMFQ